jgi:aspartyl-tRNA(Asn)/glutamyl-tRNA(Gln) amidotransferase subunit C
VALTPTDVVALARLARIELSETELAQLAPQLDVILESVARVSEVAAGDIPTPTHAHHLPRDQVLAGAPAAEQHRFRVPRILEEEA